VLKDSGHECVPFCRSVVAPFFLLSRLAYGTPLAMPCLSARPSALAVCPTHSEKIQSFVFLNSDALLTQGEGVVTVFGRTAKSVIWTLWPNSISKTHNGDLGQCALGMAAGSSICPKTVK